jgi:hypothetical protein
MAVKRRRSPQEKKQLSYSRDRRNVYGESDKGSRKTIARNKRARHRSERHRQRQDLAAATGPVDEDAEAIVHDRVTQPRRGSRWRKFPDAPLGLYITATLQRRIDMGISSPQTEQARISKVRRNTASSDRTLRWKHHGYG